MSIESKSVVITMLDKTITQVEEIQQKLHSISFSDAINQAIMTTTELLHYLEKGSKIIIENKSGAKFELSFAGA